MRRASGSPAQNRVLLGSLLSGRARVPVPPLGQESGSSLSVTGLSCFRKSEVGVQHPPLP